jgi:hypothetical protein
MGVEKIKAAGFSETSNQTKKLSLIINEVDTWQPLSHHDPLIRASHWKSIGTSCGSD